MGVRDDGAIAAFQSGDLKRARELAQEQLAAEPHAPPLLHLMGLVQCRLGEIKSGVEWLRRASEAEPDNVSYRVMLARALVDSGRPQEALDVARPPGGVSPADLALWHVRAEAADAAGDLEASVESWQAFCSVRPTDWRAWSNYGEALAKVDRWEEAAIALRRAADLAPGETGIRRNLASALSRADAYEESAAELRQLVREHPDEPRLRLTLSRVLADLGRHEDSMAELEAAARLTIGAVPTGDNGSGLIGVALQERERNVTDDQPSEDEIDAVRELALLLERTNRIDALRTVLTEAESMGIARGQLGYAAASVALRDGDAAQAKSFLLTENPDVDRVRWHRLMTKIADALGDPVAAFAEAQAMNRSVRDFENWRSQGAEYRQRLRGLADVFTAEWAAALPAIAPGERRSPAFLVGFPRSGTTLADTFLMGHSETQVLEEVHMLGAAETAIGGVLQLPQCSPEQIRNARRAYFAELDRHVDPAFTGLVIDKLPLNMLGLPFIYTLFPDARIIFAQRHPCDAVLSGFMQSFVLNPAMASFLDIDDAAELYDTAMQVFSRSREALPQLPVHTLVYEQLVADTEGALRPLIEFLGLEWKGELLDHQSTARSRGAIITPSYDQVVQPLSRAPSGRWRRYKEQLEPVLPVLLPWARRLGYSD